MYNFTYCRLSKTGQSITLRRVQWNSCHVICNRHQLSKDSIPQAYSNTMNYPFLEMLEQLPGNATGSVFCRPLQHRHNFWRKELRIWTARSSPCTKSRQVHQQSWSRLIGRNQSTRLELPTHKCKRSQEATLICNGFSLVMKPSVNLLDDFVHSALLQYCLCWYIHGFCPPNLIMQLVTKVNRPLT